MLYLSRKVGQSIIINNHIEVTVVEVKGKTVKLGVSFPPDASVLRKEIHEKISQENLAASTSNPLDDHLIDLIEGLELDSTANKGGE